MLMLPLLTVNTLDDALIAAPLCKESMVCALGARFFAAVALMDIMVSSFEFCCFNTCFNVGCAHIQPLTQMLVLSQLLKAHPLYLICSHYSLALTGLAWL